MMMGAGEDVGEKVTLFSSSGCSSYCRFVNSHPDPTGRARRTWWPSPASCAFAASGLEILSFGLWLFYLRVWILSVTAAREHPVPPSRLIYIASLIAVIDIAAQA